MEKATVSKLKNNLSAYLRRVRAGQSLIIYDRDVPVARLERIESSGADSERLALLQSRGLVRPPLRPLTSARLKSTLRKVVPRDVGLSRALTDERDEGR